MSGAKLFIVETGFPNSFPNGLKSTLYLQMKSNSQSFARTGFVERRKNLFSIEAELTIWCLQVYFHKNVES